MKLSKGYSAVPAGVLPVRLDLPERQVHGDGNAHKEKAPGPPQGALLVRVDQNQVSLGEELRSITTPRPHTPPRNTESLRATFCRQRHQAPRREDVETNYFLFTMS